MRFSEVSEKQITWAITGVGPVGIESKPVIDDTGHDAAAVRSHSVGTVGERRCNRTEESTTW